MLIEIQCCSFENPQSSIYTLVNNTEKLASHQRKIGVGGKDVLSTNVYEKPQPCNFCIRASTFLGISSDSYQFCPDSIHNT